MIRISPKCFLMHAALLAILFTVMMMRTALAQKTQNVTGVVKDATGATLPGVSVRVKGSKIATATNQNGIFVIRAFPGDTLSFSMVGYVTLRNPIAGRASVNVVLQALQTSLNEVLVVGYGAVKKSDLTGSVSQVSIADITKAPVSSFTESLAGRVAGVQVSSADGQPGGGVNIVIRGANSLTQSNAPLYVIDGFPIEDPENAAINPEDIASINILKDASATAIYGSRGANGVVVVETKKGKVGKPQIEVKSSYGFQQRAKEMEMMSPYEFVKYYSEFFPAQTAATYFTNGKSLDNYSNEPGIDWQREVERPSLMQINSIALRGGTDQTKYSVSGSMYDQNGVVINSDYKRYQFGANLDQWLSKSVRVGINTNFSHISTNGETFSAIDSRTIDNYTFYSIWGYRPVSGDPNINLLDEDFDPYNPDDIHNLINPLTQRENDYTKKGANDLRGNAYLSIGLANGLTFKTTGSIDYYEAEVDKFNNSKTPLGRISAFNTRGVNGSINNSSRYVWSNENTLTYDKQLNGGHHLNLLGGFSSQGIHTAINGFAAQNVPNETLQIDGLDEGTPYVSSLSHSTSTLASFYGRVNYSYKSRYLLTGTFRADGSSKFAPGNRWGYFPSGAFAWNMTNEDFLKNTKWLSNSKLRVSYGLTGNNRVNDFPYLSNLSFPIGSSYSFNNGTPTLGAIPSNLANGGLRWETTSQLDIGYDLGLWNNRVEFTGDYYRKITSNLLLNADLPYSTGYTTAYENIGKIGNNGLEISIHTVNLTGKFRWESNFNISFNSNKILELTRNQQDMFTTVPLTQFNLPLYDAQVGKQAGMFYGYIFDGIYQFNDFDKLPNGTYILKSSVPTNGNARNLIQPGDIKYRDLNGDGVVNASDQGIIGRGQPIHTGGFINNFSYKGFDLGVFMQWSYGNDIYNANRLFLEGNASSTLFKNQFASYEDRWTPTNPSNTLFRAGGQGPIQHSSRVVEDGSYIRLKTLSLGYTVPARYAKKIGASQVRFNVTTQNLLTVTNYSGEDPEVSVRNSVLTPGFDFSAYPQARTITFGLNATF